MPDLKFVVTLLRSRLVSGVVLALTGGVGTFVLMRLLLVTQLNAQGQRLSSVEGKQATMENSVNILTKSACLDRSPGEQELAGMICPRNLYKGVLQGVPRADPSP